VGRLGLDHPEAGDPAVGEPGEEGRVVVQAVPAALGADLDYRQHEVLVDLEPLVTFSDPPSGGSRTWAP